MRPDFDPSELPVTYAWTRWACEQMGWQYSVRAGFDRQLFENVLAAAECAREVLGVAQFAKALLAAAHDPIPVGELELRVPAGALLRPVLWHLLWHGDLTCHWDRPVDVWTLVGRPDEAFGWR